MNSHPQLTTPNSSQALALDVLTATSSSHEHIPENYWALLFALIPLVTITGNILVIASVVREKSLQTVTNYYIVSLAVSDFFVALVVMPFAVYNEVNHNQWYLGTELCRLFILCDVGASTASIFNLFSISVDRFVTRNWLATNRIEWWYIFSRMCRFIAVTRPIYYTRQGRNNKRAFVVIASVWSASFAIAAPSFFFNKIENPTECRFNSPVYTIGSSIGSFWIPCLIMTVLYSIILKKLRDRQKQKERERLARRPKTLNIMMANLLKHASIARDVGKHLGDRADAEIASRTRTSTSSDDEFDDDDDEDDSESSDRQKAPPKRRPPAVPLTKNALTSNKLDQNETDSRQTLLATVDQSPANSTQPYNHKNSKRSTRKLNKEKIKESNVQLSVERASTTMALPEYSYASAPGDTQKYRSRQPSECIALDEQHMSVLESETATDTELSVARSCRSFGEDEFFDCLPFIDAGSRGTSVRKSAPTLSLQALEDFTNTPYGSFRLPKTYIVCATPDHTLLLTKSNDKTDKEHHTDGETSSRGDTTITPSPAVTSTEPTVSAVSITLNNNNVNALESDKNPYDKTNLSRTQSCDPQNRTTPRIEHERHFSQSLNTMRRSVWNRFKRNVHLSTVKGMIPSKKLKKNERRQIRRERKATHTLAIVLAVFLICWIPFFVCHITNAVCQLVNANKDCIGPTVWFVVNWFGYMNSCMNPLIYTIFNMEYRRAFRRILSCK